MASRTEVKWQREVVFLQDEELLARRAFYEQEWARRLNERRQASFVAETPGERPLRVIVKGYAGDEGFNPGAEAVHVYALEDREACQLAESEREVSGVADAFPPRSFYEVQEDGGLVRIGPCPAPPEVED